MLSADEQKILGRYHFWKMLALRDRGGKELLDGMTCNNCHGEGCSNCGCGNGGCGCGD